MNDKYERLMKRLKDLANDAKAGAFRLTDSELESFGKEMRDTGHELIALVGGENE